MRRSWFDAIAFAAEDGNGGAASSTATGGGDTGSAQGGSGGQGTQGAGAAGGGGSLVAAAEAAGGQSGATAGGAAAADAWFPDGLDAKLKGKDAAETLANLAKQLGEAPKPPAAAKDYAFTPDPSIAQFFGAEADGKVLDVARGVAHELGLSQPQFDGFINKFYGAAIAQGLMQKPVDAVAEITTLGGGEGTPKEIAERGMQRVLGVRDSLVGLEKAGVLGAEEAKTITSALVRAGEVVAVERLVKHIEKLSGSGGPVNGGQAGGTADGEAARLGRLYPTMTVN